MRRIFLFALMAVVPMAGAQTFFDDFNRADGGIGANYDLINGPAVNVLGNKAAGTSGSGGLTLVKSSVFTGAYTNTKVQADLSLSDVSTSLAFCALVLGSDASVASGHGLYIKLQRQSPGTGFTNIGAYTGNGINNTTAILLNGGNFQTLASPITTTRMTVSCPTATSLNIGLDNDFNGVDDVTFTGTLSFGGGLVLGNRVGLHIFGTTGRIDNYRASTVPEPASMAVLGLGIAALIRRRRK